MGSLGTNFASYVVFLNFKACSISNRFVYTLGKINSSAVLKPAVCKYPDTVIKSEIYMLLPKPYSLMRHLEHGNHVRNDRDRRPQTHRMRSSKVALLKISMDSVQYCGSMMPWMMSTAFRLGVAETACRVGVLCADSMNTFMSMW